MILNISAEEVSKAIAGYLSKTGKFKEGHRINFLEMNPRDAKKIFVVDVRPNNLVEVSDYP